MDERKWKGRVETELQKFCRGITCRCYRRNAPPVSVQKQALEPESRFTEIASEGDMETFRNLADRRHKVFFVCNGKCNEMNETHSFLDAHTGIPPPAPRSVRMAPRKE